jgi:Tn3 transposase DDE domain
VVENYNGVNDYIRFGKRGELASNRHEEQELGMLCLHILQSSPGLPRWRGVSGRPVARWPAGSISSRSVMAA